MSEWKALAGRITVFPAPSSVALPSALDFYKKLWGADPISFQGASNPLSPSVAQGKIDILGLTCSIHPSRIDLTISAVGPENISGPPKLPLIEDSASLYRELRRIADMLGKELLTNPVIRVATFLQFVCHQASSIEANKVIMSIIPDQYRLKLIDEDEFMMQVNRPRQSTKLKDIKLNLLTKWSVDRFQIISVVVPAGATPVVAPQSGVTPQIYEFIAASVSFDFNNVPVPVDKPLDSIQQSTILLETLEQAATSISEAKLNIRGFENGKTIH